MQKLLYFTSVDTSGMSWAQCMNKFQEEDDWHKAKEYLQDGMEKRTINLRNHSKLILGKRLASERDGEDGQPESEVVAQGARRAGESATALAFDGRALPISPGEASGAGPRRSKRMRITEAGEEDEEANGNNVRAEASAGGAPLAGAREGKAGKAEAGAEGDNDDEGELTEEEELDPRAIYKLGVDKHTYLMTIWGRSYAFGLVQTMNVSFLDKASLFEGSHAPAYLMCELLAREHNAVSYCMNTKDWRTGFDVMLATIIAMGAEFYWTFTDDGGEEPSKVLEDLAKVWIVIVRKLAVFPPGHPEQAIVSIAELSELDYAWDELAKRVNEAKLPADVALLNKFALAKAQTRLAIEQDKPAVVKARMCRHCNVPLKGHRAKCPVLSARKNARQKQKDTRRKAKSIVMLKQFYDMHMMNDRELDSPAAMVVNAVLQRQALSEAAAAAVASTVSTSNTPTLTATTSSALPSSSAEAVPAAPAPSLDVTAADVATPPLPAPTPAPTNPLE